MRINTLFMYMEAHIEKSMLILDQETVFIIDEGRYHKHHKLMYQLLFFQIQLILNLAIIN